MFFAFSMGVSARVMAQPETNHRLSLHMGAQHITMLDEQATPVLYQGMGPQVALAYEWRAPTHWWQFGLNGGLLRFQPADPEVSFSEPYLSGIAGGLHISYLHLLRENEKSTWMLGASIQEELLVDFEGIGNWPYILGQGGIYAKGRWDYLLTHKHHIGAVISFPMLAWLTDMPYHQIPRVEGRAPDVVSAIRIGTRIPSWDSYQRVDIKLMYEFHFNEKWSFCTHYDWAWFHDAKPHDLWAYQGRLAFGLIHKW